MADEASEDRPDIWGLLVETERSLKHLRTAATAVQREIDAAQGEVERLGTIAALARCVRAEREAAALREILGSLWLHVNWRGTTKQLTTEQKERWATVLERQWVEDGINERFCEGESPLRVDRWWLCPTCGERISNGRDDGPHEGCMYAHEKGGGQP